MLILIFVWVANTLPVKLFPNLGIVQAVEGGDPVNLAAAARGTVATASSRSSDRPPERANDGNPGTSWGPLAADKNTGEVWLSLDFGEEITFDRVTLDFAPPASTTALPLSYEVKVADDPSFTGTYDDDPSKWRTIASRVLTDYEAAAADDITFTEESVQRLTVVFSVNPAAAIPRVNEIEVYHMARDLVAVGISADQTVLYVPESSSLSAYAIMSDGGTASLDSAELEWSSSNSAVVQVTDTGGVAAEVTALAAGQATITATATLDGVSKTGELVLLVQDLTLPVNLAASALGVEAAASSRSSDRPPENANDGSPATHWGPLSSDHSSGEVWLSLDFGKETVMDRVVMDFGMSSNSSLPLSYEIKTLMDSHFTGSYDDDPSKWGTVASGSQADYLSGVSDITFGPVAAERLTVVFTVNPSAPIIRLNEIEVYQMSRELQEITVLADALVLTPGEEAALEWRGQMSDGSLPVLDEATVTWSSNPSGVVQLVSSEDSGAVVTAIAPGSAIVTAQVELDGVTRSGTFTFRVKDPAAEDSYGRMLEKWKMRLIGEPGYNAEDPDIAAAINTIVAAGLTNLNSMNSPSSEAFYLWSGYENGEIGDAETSYNRLLAMAKAYELTGTSLSPSVKTRLREAIAEGMEFLNTNWYNASVAQTNQWYKFEIGVPKAILDLTVLMHDELVEMGQQSVITSHMDATSHFSPHPAHSRTATSEPRYNYMTGANLVEKSLLVSLRGIVNKDSTDLVLARNHVVDVLEYVTEGDGFYEDGSFIQHGNVPYTGSYGLVMIDVLPSLLGLLSGSNWEVNDPRIDHIYEWMYNSFEPVFFRGLLMDMVRGRAISRYHIQDWNAGRSYLLGLSEIAEFAPPADAEYFKANVKAWADSELFDNFYRGLSIYRIGRIKAVMNDNTLPSIEAPVYHKQFPAMDRIVHHRPDFSFAISMFSNRIRAYEYQGPPQEENRRGYYTGEGMTYLYNDDVRQFNNAYWPTVDAKRLPGITVDYGQVRADGSGSSYRSSEHWVGGTDIAGLYGVAGMRVDGWNNTLAGNKSWFMFDDEIVALGSGITSTDNRPVETVVENRQLNAAGDNVLTVDGQAKPTSLSWSETMSGVQWAHLSGDSGGGDIGYYFPGGAAIHGLREARSGKWSDINPYIQRGEENVTHTRNYLSLVFGHGHNPVNETYAYVLLPNRSAALVSQYASAPDIEIIENSSDVQAVKEHQLQIVAANFWQDGVHIADIIKSNKKSSIMTRIDGNELEVSVSDPTQLNTGTIEVEIARSAADVITSDPRVTISQLSPTVRLQIDVNGAKGQAVQAAFELED